MGLCHHISVAHPLCHVLWRKVGEVVELVLVLRLRDGYESCQLLAGSSSSKRYVQQMSLSTQTLFPACSVSWEIVPGHQGVVDLNLTNTCCLSQGCRTNGQDLHPAGRRCLLRHVIETVTASEINWAGPCLLISQ